ncbi:MAG: carbon-nitrogen hydrolase family protein, partial [Solirubrobacterales bacterium]|nr:carbon-nitrogen hydrolase family protein [Solirubrobacterales bacterium]
MRAAAVQLNSTDDVDRNLATADRLVREAASRGAQLVVLPEKWSV